MSAIVSGGASGLGEAVTRRLHGDGMPLVIADLNEEKGMALAGELGDGVEFAPTDVTDEEQVRAAVAKAAEAGEDGLRVSVACAGIGWAQKTAGRDGPHDLNAFQTVVNVNLVGSFNLLRLAADVMRANEPRGSNQRGVCVSTASIAAYDGQMGQIAYAASKGGIVSMTLPAARDLSRDGIRVLTIAPGLFDTPLLAALPEEARKSLGESVPNPQRLGLPDEFAALTAHIVENEMLNGEVIRLDGALRMAPR
jgi:3-hydroxyacyl-CoA dehydrogenase / 3-hydroxy-2-methylbutyryl-CoA dehydrogenase